MSSNENNTSTLQSYVDSATGVVKDTVGSLTGNTSQQTSGQAKQDKADLEHDASHATAKGPGFTATADGVSKDDPDRTTGQYNQAMGSAKQAVGAVLSTGLQKDGERQRKQGEQQEAEGQAKDYVQGGVQRAGNAVSEGIASLTGDAEAQKEAQARHDAAKTQQRGAEHDILKNAEAEKKAQDKTA